MHTYDFLLATREKRGVATDMIRTEALKRNHFVTSTMFSQHEDVIQDGDEIVDFIQLETNDTADWYNPKGSFSPVLRDLDFQIKVMWAFISANYSLIREEKRLNGAARTRFYKHVQSKELGCVGDMVGAMEAGAWALPDKRYMEDAITDDTKARRPLSFLSIITRDGLAPSSTNGGVVSGSGDWSTLATIDPAAYPNFRNQAGTYDASNPFSLDLNVGLVPAFRMLARKMKFVTPAMVKKVGGDAGLSEAMDSQVWCTSNEGCTLYESALNMLNDRGSNLRDVVTNGIRVNGHLMVDVAELDDAGWTSGEPDYIGIDFKAVKPFIQGKEKMDEEVVGPSREHPNKTTVFKFSGCGMLPLSRKRLGRLSAA